MTSSLAHRCLMVHFIITEDLFLICQFSQQIHMVFCFTVPVPKLYRSDYQRKSKDLILCE